MTQVPSYDPAVVEARWQERWARERTNEPDLDQPRRPFYNLMMFPYPSAEGLHVGNMFAFTGADIYGRFKRLQGYDVFEPIGFDAFGIHSENYALSVGTHPAKLIPQNIETFRRQLRRFGGMFDWRHELSTTDPRYYKWTQWIFLQLFKGGIAFRKKAAVNWCPKDMSVVANEQVINGYCERHPDTKVEQRFLEQWFFTITRYAERLLNNLDRLDWSDSTRTLQRNWIGRSEGAELIFETPAGAKIPVFTTRPDTVFGATYLVLAPEHPFVDQLTAEEQRRQVNAYRREVQGKDLVSRRVGDKTKTGVFLGSYARNPATGEAIPIWIADYVLMEYGTGAIMAPVQPPHPRGGARRRGGTAPQRDGRWGARQFGRVRRAAVPRGPAPHRRLATGEGARHAAGTISPARLVHFAATLLGPSDPDHPLRPVRSRRRAGAGPSRPAADDRGLPA